jgi:hypothetical protein
MLAEALYSKHPFAWRGEELWQCVKTYRKAAAPKKLKPTLPSINPDADFR